MKRAIEGLNIFPDIALIDGQHAPQTECKVRTIVKGDQSKKNIMAASILAKVSRDNYMKEIDNKYPEYGFKQHIILHPGFDFRVVERKGLNGRILPQASERFAVFCGLGQGEEQSDGQGGSDSRGPCVAPQPTEALRFSLSSRG